MTTSPTMTKTKTNSKRWQTTDDLFNAITLEQVEGHVVFDKWSYIKVRLDLMPDLEGVDLTSIQVFSSGALFARVEALAAYPGSPQTVRAENVIRLGILSRGILLQPAFTTYSKTDARLAQRFFREEDIKNWCSFFVFCERSKLQAETNRRLSAMEEPLRGMMLYHLWLNADTRFNPESPPPKPSPL